MIGAYQALFLDRVPAHSIVDESVRLVALARTEASYRGLANAILRRLVGDRESLARPGDDMPWLLRFSVPEWIASEGGQVFREGANERFFAASNEAAPLHLRISRRSQGEMSTEEVVARVRAEIVDLTNQLPEVELGAHAPDALIVRGRGVAPEYLPSFRRGLVTAEDEAAQLVGWLAGARADMRMLDLCASPGGKTAHLLDVAGPTARIVATDVSEQKLQRLRETLSRLGIVAQAEIRLADSLTEETHREAFDLILVDAPCSGLGTLRRHPEIRWRRQPKDIRALATQQLALLEKAALMLRPGGILVYSVCTFTRAETDQVADRFLARHRTFAAAPAPPDAPIREAAFRTGTGRWRTSPHEHGTDAFFVARFTKGFAPAPTEAAEP